MSVFSAVRPQFNTINFGWVVALITIFGFSFQPTASKLVLEDGWSPISQITVRYVTVVILMFATIALTSPKLLRIDRRGLIVSVMIGLASVAALYLFITSLTRMSSAVASMVFASYPLFVLVILAFRGERLSYRNIVRLTLGLLGIFLLIGPSGSVDLVGVAMVVGACTLFAVYLIMMQYVREYNGQTILLYVWLTIAVTYLGIWLWQGAELQPLTTRGWFGMGLLVIVCTYMAYLCLFIAVRYIGSAQMALLNPIEPFLTIIWSSLLLGEFLTPVQWFGSSLIIVSMILVIERLDYIPRRILPLRRHMPTLIRR